jgi:hypothetical protein
LQKIMKKISTIAMAAALGLAVVSTAQAQYGGPFGLDTAPGVVITYSGGTGLSFASSGQGPYDGADDTWVGVHNASGGVLNSITLSGPNIFGFDGDGIQDYGSPPVPGDTTGYAGPGTSFVVVDANDGTVDFTGGLAAGGYAYFSLEESVGSGNGAGGTGITGGGASGVPDAGSTMALLGGALVGLGGLRRRFMA